MMQKSVGDEKTMAANKVSWAEKLTIMALYPFAAILLWLSMTLILLFAFFLIPFVNRVEIDEETGNVIINGDSTNENR